MRMKAQRVSLVDVAVSNMKETFPEYNIKVLRKDKVYKKLIVNGVVVCVGTPTQVVNFIDGAITMKKFSEGNFEEQTEQTEQTEQEEE